MRNSFIIYLLISFCLIYSCSSFKKNNYNEAETLHSDSLKYLLTDNYKIIPYNEIDIEVSQEYLKALKLAGQ